MPHQDCSILRMEILSATELLVLPDVERRLKIVDLDKLEVTKEFQGYVPKRSNVFRLVHGRNGIFFYMAFRIYIPFNLTHSR